jgi:hypothetical protein
MQRDASAIAATILLWCLSIVLVPLRDLRKLEVECDRWIKEH